MKSSEVGAELVSGVSVVSRAARVLAELVKPLGAPGLDSETWESTNSPCPILRALREGWDTTNQWVPHPRRVLVFAARVGYQDSSLAGQRQSRISGRSSPFSATYSLCRWMASEYHCSAASACAANRGTRRTASSDNWKRSMLLSTHISKGVVVVPSRS